MASGVVVVMGRLPSILLDRSHQVSKGVSLVLVVMIEQVVSHAVEMNFVWSRILLLFSCNNPINWSKVFYWSRCVKITFYCTVVYSCQCKKIREEPR